MTTGAGRVLRVASALDAGRDRGSRASHGRPPFQRLEPDVRHDDTACVEATGRDDSPTLAAWNVTVRSARTAAPSTSPVEAFTPDGRSTATTGAPAALIRSITPAASGRGSPWKPVPKSASITTSAPTWSCVSSASKPASRINRAATRPSPPFEPPPQTTAKRGRPGRPQGSRAQRRRLRAPSARGRSG